MRGNVRACLLAALLAAATAVSAGCGGGKIISGGFDKPQGGTLASASDSADTASDGANAILRALTMMDGLIINPVIFFDNIIQQSPPNYELYEQQTVMFGETPVQFSYTSNIRDSIDPEGFVLVKAQSPPLPQPSPSATAVDPAPVYLSTSYRMRYHTTSQEAPERLTEDGYIRDFTVNNPQDADLVEDLLLQADRIQIRQDGEKPFLVDPTDGANMTVRLLRSSLPLEFRLDLSSQKVSSESGFSARNTLGILAFFLDGEFIFDTSDSNAGYPTGTARGSVITLAEDINWLFYIASTTKNRYYFKLSNENLGYFEGILILTK
jgi:hypothetical protein